MKLVEKATGKIVDVPDAQAQAAFTSGKFGIPKGAPMPVRAPGLSGVVDAPDASAALAQGMTPSTEEQYRQAQIEGRFGGFGGGAAAAGVGVARGAAGAFGVPLDAAAIGLAEMGGPGFSGHDEVDPYKGARHVSAAESLRETLKGLQEAHPIASFGGELAGMAGAAALGGGGVMGAAEEAGQALGGTAARFAAGGGVVGGIGAMNEAALGDEKITAAKIMAGIGHGALVGGAMGAGASLGGAALAGARDRFGRWLATMKPESVETLAKAHFGYAPEGLGERIQQAYARTAGAVSGKDADLISKFTELSPEGAAARRVGVFDADEITAKAERDIRVQIDNIMRAGDLVSAEARGGLKADYVKRAVKTGNEGEALAATLQRFDDLEAGIDRQLAQDMAPSMVKSANTVKKLIAMAREIAEKRRTTSFAPFIDADAGLEGGFAMKKPFHIGAEERPVFLRPDGKPRVDVEEPIDIRRGVSVDTDAGLRGGAESGKAIHGTGKGVYSKTTEHIPIADINVPEPWNPSRLRDVKAKRDAGVELDPIRVARGDDGRWEIVDGIHRTNDAIRRGETHIRATYETGKYPQKLNNDVFNAKKGIEAEGGAFGRRFEAKVDPDAGLHGDVEAKDAFRLSSAESVPRRIDADLADAESVATAKTRPVKFDRQTAPDVDNADLFIALDNLKRGIQRLTKNGYRSIRLIADPVDQLNAQRTVSWLDGAASDLRSSLEDSELWGKAADDQRAINAAWTKQLDSSKRFHRSLTTEIGRDPNNPYLDIRGADPAKVSGYVKNLTNPNNDLTHTAVRNYVENTRELADAISKSYDLPAEKLAEVARVKDAAASFGSTIADAEKTLVTANQFRALMSAPEGGTFADALGTVGGIVGGLPGGLLGSVVGAATGALRNPGKMIAQMAALERIASKVDHDIAHGVTGFLSGAGAKSTGRAGAVEMLAATGKSERAAFEAKVGEVRRLAGNKEELGARIRNFTEQFADAAPGVAKALTYAAVKGIEYLAQTAPPGFQPRPEALEWGIDEPPMYTDAEMREWSRRAAVVNDPLTAVRSMKRKMITPEEADALKVVHTPIFEALQREFRVQRTEKKTPMTYGQTLQIEIMFGVPLNRTLERGFMGAVQKTFSVAEPSMKNPNSGGSSGRMSRSYASTADSIRSGG